jgi:anti-anti-sigma factor
MPNITLPSTAKPQPGTVSFSLAGDLLSTNAQAVRSELEQLLASAAAAPGHLKVFEADLRKAQMIDSVGLNLLVWLIKSVRGRDARLRLLISSVHVERTLKFTRLDQQAEVVSQ